MSRLCHGTVRSDVRTELVRHAESLPHARRFRAPAAHASLRLTGPPPTGIEDVDPRTVIRKLPLRTEHPPDDATVVLRAGVMGAEGLRRSAQRMFDATQSSASRWKRCSIRLCWMHAEAVSGSPAIDRSACRPSAGSARPASRSWPGHLADLSEVTLARLTTSFDDPIPNPAGSRDG